MSSSTELMLAPQFDGLAAVLRALVSELESANTGVRQKLARAAATDIRARMKDANRDAARDVMLATAAITCGVPIGSLAGN
jgi:septal ring factor EnvC (AmiA/AmiB activator)